MNGEKSGPQFEKKGRNFKEEDSPPLEKKSWALWAFPTFHLCPTEQPTDIPNNIDSMPVRPILNLRGHNTPPYTVPEKATYRAMFVKGGPTGNISVSDMQRAVRYIASTPAHSVCVVHCQHGLNRTGAVVCAAAIALTRVDCSHAVQYFSQLRPPGIQREWIHRTLRCWSNHCRKYSALCKPSTPATHVRKHRTPVHNHPSPAHIGQHTMHVARKRRDTLLHAHRGLRHRHDHVVFDQIHERPPAKASRATKQEKKGKKLKSGCAIIKTPECSGALNTQ